MSTESPGVRLGDLLTGAGLLSIEALREAMLTAKQQQMPVGRILITSGYLSENQLQATVQAQSLLKDGLVEMPTVVKALAIIAQEQTSLDNALARCGWQRQLNSVSNKLGELLMEAKIISPEDLQHALTQCENIGLPLGRMLVLTGSLTEQMLSNALNAQVFLRDKKITREQALKGLKAAQQRQLPLESALADSDFQLPSATSVKLGELLIEAGLVDKANLMNAVELGLLQDKLIGQVLRQLNLLSEADLSAALELQKLTKNGTLRRPEAVEVLSQCHKEKSNIADVLKRKMPPQVRESASKEELYLDQFLKIAGIINQAEIDKAIKIGSQDSDIFGKMLLMAGVMEEQMVEASLDAYALVSDSTLTMDQAMIALKNCRAKGHDLETAFKDLGWSNESEEDFAPQEETKKGEPVSLAQANTPPVEPTAKQESAAASNPEPLPQVKTIGSILDRPKTGSWNAATEPVSPSGSGSGGNPMRTTSEQPVITPVVSKRASVTATSEFEKVTIDPDEAITTAASSAPAMPSSTSSSHSQVAPTSAASAPPILPIGEVPTPVARTAERKTFGSMAVGDGGPPSWAVPQEEIKRPQPQPQPQPQIAPPVVQEVPAPEPPLVEAAQPAVGATSGGFAALKTAAGTKRSSQWLEAIEEQPATAPPVPPTPAPVAAPIPEPVHIPAPVASPAAVEPNVPPPIPEPIPAPAAVPAAETPRPISALARLQPKGLARVPAAAGAPKPVAAPQLEPEPPPPAPQGFPPQPEPEPQLPPPPQPQPEVSRSQRFSNALPQPASSIRNSGSQQTPGPTGWGFGSAQPPKSNPWDVTEEDEVAAASGQTNGQDPAPPPTPQADQPVPVATAPAYEEQQLYEAPRPEPPHPEPPRQEPIAAPTYEYQQAPIPITQPNMMQPQMDQFQPQPDRFQPQADRFQPQPDPFHPQPDPFQPQPDPFQPQPQFQQQQQSQPDAFPQQPQYQPQQPPAVPAAVKAEELTPTAWGQPQKAKPPNPWGAALARATGEQTIPVPSGLSFPGQLPTPEPQMQAIPPTPAPAAVPVLPLPPEPSPPPVPAANAQPAVPAWTSPAQENPGWAMQTGTAPPSGTTQPGMSTFSDNPGWKPAAPTPAPQPQLPPEPAPQAPAALPPAEVPAAQAAAGEAQPSWEYAGGEPAPQVVAKPKGLNAFMPKGKKDK